MATVHAGLVSALPADLVTAGVVTAVAQVYFGRRAQNPARQDVEVWAERLDVDEVGTGGQVVRAHRYRLHVRGGPSNRGADQAGTAQVTAVEAAQRLVVERYHGQRRLYATSGLAGLIAFSAVADQADVDPEEGKVLDGAVLLTAFVKE